MNQISLQIAITILETTIPHSRLPRQVIRHARRTLKKTLSRQAEFSFLNWIMVMQQSNS